VPRAAAVAFRRESPEQRPSARVATPDRRSAPPEQHGDDGAGAQTLVVAM